MGTSYSNLVTYVRDDLREASANTWTDAQLARYLSRAERWLAGYLSQIKGSGRFITRGESFTIAASTETFDTTTLANTPTGILEMMMQFSGEWYPIYEMAQGDENLLRSTQLQSFSNLTPPQFWIEDTTLHFLPLSTSARTCKISYQWLPAVKGTGGTAETPDRYDDVLLLRAAYDAMRTQGQDDEAFEKKYAGRLAEIEDFEFGRQSKGTSRVIQNVSARVLFPRT